MTAGPPLDDALTDSLTGSSNQSPRLGEVVRELQRGGLELLEIRMLIECACGLSAVKQIAHPEFRLSTTQWQKLRALAQRREAGEPMAYLIGRRDFFGRSFQVDARVLIPRPETELLIDLALSHLPQSGRVLDLGTGSGAIAVTLACERRNAEVIATDLSAAALEVAQANATQLGARVRFIESDWFASLDAELFDLILANPPYIATNDAHLDQGDLRHEPRLALTDGADGLNALRSIIQVAPLHLKPGGWLFVEHGYDQAEVVRRLLIDAHFMAVNSWQDLAGIERVSGGRVNDRTPH